jgi:hypothetical protein
MQTTLVTTFDDPDQARAALQSLSAQAQVDARLCDGRGDDAPLEFTRWRQGALAGALVLAPMVAIVAAIVSWTLGGQASFAASVFGALFGALLGLILGGIAGAADPIFEPIGGRTWLAVRASDRSTRDELLARLVLAGGQPVTRR